MAYTNSLLFGVNFYCFSSLYYNKLWRCSCKCWQRKSILQYVTCSFLHAIQLLDLNETSIPDVKAMLLSKNFESSGNISASGCLNGLPKSEGHSAWLLTSKSSTELFCFSLKGRNEILSPHSDLNLSHDENHAREDHRGPSSCHSFDCSHSTGTWVGSGNTSPMMSRPSDPRVTGLENVLAHCPQAKVKYVNVVHVDFIWTSMISSQTLNCNPPPWETHSRQETVCFC